MYLVFKLEVLVCSYIIKNLNKMDLTLFYEICCTNLQIALAQLWKVENLENWWKTNYVNNQLHNKLAERSLTDNKKSDKTRTVLLSFI